MTWLLHPLFGFAADTSPPSLDPADLFAGSEEGFWYDVQDQATLWADTARTVAATVGNPVRAITDKSGNGHHATTASADVAPILRLNETTGAYYLEFDGVDDNLTTTVNFGSVGVLSTVAGLRNRMQTDLAGYLDMSSSGSPGPSTMRIRQLASAGTTIWDALLNGAAGEGTDARAQVNTTAPNTMIMSSQHDMAGDLSTVRVNGFAGMDGTGDKGAGLLGAVDVNIGKLPFRTGVAADLYGLIVVGALLGDAQPAEYYMDGIMGGGIMPPYSPPGPDPVFPSVGFARDLNGRFQWNVFGQPISTTEHADNFGFWQDVGVTVMGGWNPDVSSVSGYDPANLASFTAPMEAAAEAWDAAAIAKGFKLDRFPFTADRALADLEVGMREHIVGWSVQDEAEAGSGFDIAPQLALMDAADPTFEIIRSINSTGPAVIYEQAAVLFPYFNQFAGYPAVQAMFDYYPVQQTTAGKTVVLMYRPNGQPYTATHNSQGLVSARDEEWSLSGVPTTNYLSHSPYSLFIATGGFVEGYQTTLRIPTPEQVRFQIADAIVMGAEGISFFPQKFEWLESPPSSGNFYKTFTSFNGTPSDVKTQLTTTIANWQALETEFAANLLIDPATNRMWPSTYRVCPDTSPSGIQDTMDSGWTFAAPPTADYLPGPFQGSVRDVDGVGLVYFVQNLANASASLTDATWGFTAVSFAAWETLVFIEGDLVNAVWSDIDGILP